MLGNGNGCCFSDCKSYVWLVVVVAAAVVVTSGGSCGVCGGVSDGGVLVLDVSGASGVYDRKVSVKVVENWYW